MIFFDSDICIDILHEIYLLTSFTETFSSNERFAITSLTVFELYMGYYKLKFRKNKLNAINLAKERKNIQQLIQGLYIFPLNDKAAQKAAKLFRKLEASGKELDPFDCLIAAVILSNGYSKILTRKIHHFKRIDGIIPINP